MVVSSGRCCSTDTSAEQRKGIAGPRPGTIMAGPADDDHPVSRPECIRAESEGFPAVKDRRTHDDEECRPPPPPKRRPGRPRRVRQDDAGRAAALPGRGDRPARSRRRRVGPPRLRARGAEAPGFAEPGGRHVRIRRDPHLPPRHAGLSRLRRRGRRGLRRGRRRHLRRGRLGRRGGRARAGGRHGACHEHRGLLLHQQVRPRERQPDGGARRAAGDVRDQDRAAQPGDRRGGDVRGIRRPRPPQGVSASTVRRRSRSRSPTSLPERSQRAATSCSKLPPKPTTTS